MPNYSEDPSLYPEFFFQILQKRPRVVAELTLDDPRHAEALRFKFYGFKKALLNSPQPEHQALGRVATQTTVRILRNPSRLIFEPQERVYELARASLRFADGAEPASAAPLSERTVADLGEELFKLQQEGDEAGPPPTLAKLMKKEGERG